MGSTGSVALVRANGFGTLPHVIETRGDGTTLGRAFARVGLPLAILHDGTIPIPAHTMARLFASAAEILGDPTVGLAAGEMLTTDTFGAWGRFVRSAPTLGGALTRACTAAWAHSSDGGFALEELGGVHLFSRRGGLAPSMSRQETDHFIASTIALCRLYAGPRWRPEWVAVRYARDASATGVERRLGVPVRYEQPSDGVPLRRDLLNSVRLTGPIENVPSRSLRNVNNDCALALAPEPARSVSAVVELRLLDGRTDIEGAAAMTGWNAQAIQRRLGANGLTYREIVEYVRKKQALSMLADRDLSVIEIPTALGYAEHSNFTRAFRRWTGMSPSTYRARTATAPSEAPRSAGRLHGQMLARRH